MDRRSFLKLIGVASIALVLPTGVQALVDLVVKGDYDEDILRELFGDICNAITKEEWIYLNNLNETYTLYQVNNTRVKVTTDINRKRKQYAGKEITILGISQNIFDASIKQREHDKEVIKRLGNKYVAHPYFWMRIRVYRGLKGDARKRQGISLSANMDKISKKTRALNKAQVFQMKKEYQLNPNYTLTEIGAMFSVTNVTARKALMNEMKVNYGEPIKLHTWSRGGIDYNNPQSIIDWIDEYKCVYKTDFLKYPKGQRVRKFYYQYVKEGKIKPFLLDNRGKQGQQINAGYYTKENRKKIGNGNKKRIGLLKKIINIINKK